MAGFAKQLDNLAEITGLRSLGWELYGLWVAGLGWLGWAGWAELALGTEDIEKTVGVLRFSSG